MQSLVCYRHAVSGYWTDAENVVGEYKGKIGSECFQGFCCLYFAKHRENSIKMRSIITALDEYSLLIHGSLLICDLLREFRRNLATPSSGEPRKFQYSSTMLWETLRRACRIP